MSRNYEVTIRGHLSKPLASEFEQLELVAVTKPAETVLCGPLEDQAALYGVLRRIEALGLELVEVRPVCAASRPAGPSRGRGRRWPRP